MQKRVVLTLVTYSIFTTIFAGQVIIVNKNEWDLNITVFDSKQKSNHLKLKKAQTGCILSPETVTLVVLKNPDGNQYPYQTEIKKGHKLCVEAYWNKNKRAYDFKPFKDCPFTCKLTQKEKR